MTHAAVYARKSTDQVVSADARSVARQIDNARAFAAKKGWTVTDDHVYQDDGVSGAEFARRPGLQRLLTAAKTRAFSIVIVSEQKSLGREMAETSYLLKVLAKAGIEVVEYVHGRSLTPRTSIDKLLSYVQGFSDEDHREKSRERVHEAHARLATQGRCTGGRVFGYANRIVFAGTDPHGNPLRSHVVREIVETEAVVVRRIFQLFADGHGLKSIAKILTTEGAVAPRPFVRKDPTKVLPVRGWAPGTIKAILGRDLYRGVIVWNRSRKRNEWGETAQRPRPQTEWLTTKAPELRIIDEALWKRVAARRADTAGKTLRFADGRISGRPPKHGASNLLAGLATCAVCGGSLVVETSSRKQGRVPQYICFRRRTNGTCTNDLRLNVEDVNEAVLHALEEHALTPEAIESVIQLSEQDDLRVRQAALVKERADVEKRLARLVTAVENGGDVAVLTTRMRELERRRTAIAEEVAMLRPVPRLPRPVISSRLAEWRRLLRGSTTQARAVVQRIVAGRITFIPAGEGYRFEAQTRFDKLFTGLVVPPLTGDYADLERDAGRGTERITERDVPDYEYGQLLDRAVARVHAKGGTSPTGFEPVFWP